MITRILFAITFSILWLPVHAANVKFVYVYGKEGSLLTPLNAAERCPDPESLQSASSICRGVKVSADGNYQLRLNKEDAQDSQNVILVANEYRLVSIIESGQETVEYILLGSKRRADSVRNDTHNRGYDINKLSEASVSAIERVKQVPQGKRGSVLPELLEAVSQLPLARINAAMNNSAEDNNPISEEKQRERNIAAIEQESLDDEQLSELVSFAELVVDQVEDDKVAEIVRKNVAQVLAQTANLSEAGERIFNHVSLLQNAASDETIVFLQADKYRVYVNESIKLTTENSINPASIFAYTWDGVESILSTASFSRSQPGSYLVCVSGEIDNSSDSSTDCVRILVKGEVEAIARADFYRVGTENEIFLSADLSIGAQRYTWSGSGVFSDTSTSQSLWTAPSEPGIYEIDLSINEGEDQDSVSVEVFEVLPVAIAEADKYIKYLQDGQVQYQFRSGSISTDGSKVDSVLWRIVEQPQNSVAKFSDSSASNTTLSISTPGKYIVELRADKRDKSDTVEVSVFAREENAVVAVAGPDVIAFRGTAVQLNAGLSYAPPGASLKYQWLVDSGEITNPNEAITRFISQEIGEHRITLEVSDGHSISRDEVIVTVKNRSPETDDELIGGVIMESVSGQLQARDLDNDRLQYILVSEPYNGGVTIDESSGQFVYTPGGDKGCTFSPYANVSSNDLGGNDVPVIKLCADKTVAAPNELVTLSISNSINASKFSGFTWNVDVNQIDLTSATYSSDEAGVHHICIVGHIAQSSNTSTACIDVTVDPNRSPGQCNIINNNDPGLLSGHIDVDTSNFISPLNRGASSRHTHEYDNQFDVIGIDALAMKDAHQSLFDQISENQKFKLIIVNANLSPGARVSINQNYKSLDPSSYQMATDYNKTSLVELPVFSKSGIDDSIKLENLGVYFDYRGIAYKQLHPSVSSAVRANIPGKHGEWRNGAFVIQAVAVNEDGSDAFETDLNQSAGGVHGVAVNGLLWEMSVHWHWKGPAYHESGWQDYNPTNELTEENDINRGRDFQPVSDLDLETMDCSQSSVSSGYDDLFRFKVNDGVSDSNISTIYINVGWENTPPIVPDLSISTQEETLVKTTLSASDADGHALSYRIIENGQLGSAIIRDANSGILEYQPHQDAFGQDKLSIVANDGYENSEPATVIVNINNSNDRPIAYFAGPLNVAEDQDVTSQLGGLDVDADALTYKLVTIPSKGQVEITDASSGKFHYIPNQDENGTDNFYFLVSDGTLNSAVAEVKIEIAAVNDAPMSEAQGSHTLHVDELYTGQLLASDIDRDALVYRIVDKPKKGDVQLDATSGAFIFTPSGDLGADQFSFIVSDGQADSNLSLVSFNILAANQAPQTFDQSISVFAGVEYGGKLNAVDAENSPLTFQIERGASLGELQQTEKGSAVFRFTANTLASGEDYFTFTASDGDKRSSSSTVSVNIISEASACVGPGSIRQDLDGDGYADFVESEFGTALNNPDSNPLGLNDMEYGISFSDDDDLDQYSDISELWLGSYYKDPASRPSESTLYGIPNCMSPLYDRMPPALLAFSIDTQSVDHSNGDGRAKFTLTAIDNAAGVNSVNMVLASPSGLEVEIQRNVESNPLVLYKQFVSDTFNRYAEEGTWSIKRLLIEDALGNMLNLSSADLVARNFPTQFTIVNPNSDIIAPQVHGFNVLTPLINVSSAQAQARFEVDVSDNVSGIARVAVTLRSPSGSNYRYGEVLLNESPRSGIISVETNTFESFSETGTWLISELLVADTAGNTTIFSADDLQNEGYVNRCEVLGTIEDAQNPSLIGIDILTPIIDVTQGDARAAFRVRARDDAGISEFSLILQGPSGQFMNVYYSSLDAPVELDTTLYSPYFPAFAEPGPCVYYSLRIVDGAGNISTWDAQALVNFGLQVQFSVRNALWGVSSNGIPSALSGSLQLQEDSSASGKLVALDPDGDPLNYRIVDSPRIGSVTLTNANTGEYTYTPKENTNGYDQFSFKVDDGNDESNVAIVFISVGAVDDITESKNISFSVEENGQYSGALPATNVDNDRLTFSIADNAQQGFVAINDSESGAFVYTPYAGKTGNDSFTFNINDGTHTIGPFSANITIVPELTLIGFDIQTPIVSGKELLANIATQVTLTKDINSVSEALISIIGPSGQTVTLTAFIRETHYPFLISNDIYTPDTPLESGTWRFIHLLAKKQGDSVFTLVEEDIGAAGFVSEFSVAANSSPNASGELTLTTVIDQAKDGYLLANDAEGDSLSYRIISGSSIGKVELLDAQSGRFRFTPSKLGTDSFSFIANDGLEDSNIGRVLVTVNALNGIPVTLNKNVNVSMNRAYIGYLSAADSDGDDLRFSIVNQPSLGSLELVDAVSGEYVYRPNADLTGTDVFTYRAHDGSAYSNTSSITLNISAANVKPKAVSASVVVFENTLYEGRVMASDPEQVPLTYSVVQYPTLGQLSIDATTGAFHYTPSHNRLGQDYFTFRVSDGDLYSDVAHVEINILNEEQACGVGGVSKRLDGDEDGYVDVIELEFSTNAQDNMSTPYGLNAAELGIAFDDDNDVDGYSDYIELWFNSDPNNTLSRPDYVFAPCFDSQSDGIKPRLIGFSIDTPSIDLSESEERISISLSVLDNASGMKRVRISLRSPSGNVLTKTISFSDYPLLSATKVTMDNMNEYAEAGEWSVSGITLYDEAGNRLDVSESDLEAAGYRTKISVNNSAEDNLAPQLVLFNILSSEVYPGTANDTIRVHLRLNDYGSGVSSARVDFIGPSGAMVFASTTLETPQAEVDIQLETAILSQYLEQGEWQVHSVLLVDAAGNSTQAVALLNEIGASTTLSVINPLSDSAGPELNTFGVLEDEVYPNGGVAKMEFMVNASDAAAGLMHIQIDIRGPSGQIIYAHGEFTDSRPLQANVRVSTAILSSLTESGVWTVDNIGLIDDAGNQTNIGHQELEASGFTHRISVVYH